MLTKFVPVTRTLAAATSRMPNESPNKMTKSDTMLLSLLGSSSGKNGRLQVARCMGGHAPAHWKSDKQIAIEQQAHMNDMPVPQGPWRDHYNRRNSKWNVQLAVASVILAATVYVMDRFECFYLHGHPEKK